MSPRSRAADERWDAYGAPTPPRKKSGAWIIVGGALLVLLGSAGVVGVAAWSAEKRIAKLEAQGVLPALQPSSEALTLRTRLAALRKGFAQRFEVWAAEAAEGVPCTPCAPGEWTLEHRPKLHARTVELEPLFQELDLILALPETRTLLEREEPVIAGQTLLIATRNEINALCARAIVAADSPDGSQEAARALAAALDYAALCDDRRVTGLAVRVAMEGIVLDAAARLAAHPELSTRALKRMLVPRLADYDGRARALSAARRTVAASLELPCDPNGQSSFIVPGPLARICWRARLVRDLGEFESELARGWSSLESGAELSDTPEGSGLPARLTVSAAFLAERRAGLARVALGLAALGERVGRWPDSLEPVGAELGGALPLDSSGQRPFEYRIEDGLAVVALAGTAASSERASHAGLWRIAR